VSFAPTRRSAPRFGDEAAAVGVLGLEDAVDHVGDGLEAAVWVPRSVFGLAGGVVHLAHLVHGEGQAAISFELFVSSRGQD
jgi:hypothetical protein